MENAILYLIYPIVVSIVSIFINKKIETSGKLKNEFFLKFCELRSNIFRSRAYNFTDLDISAQNDFIDLIIKSEKYAKGILLELFQDFMMYISTPNENSTEINRIFNEITEFVFDKVWKRKNKISKIERWKYNRKLKKRPDENNEIFYIRTIEKDGIVHTTDEKDC